MQIHIGSKHLVADMAVALDVSGREHLVVVAKATWSIPEPGQRPRPLKPEPLVMSDQFYGEPGESALRYGSDFARFKPQCDVIFDACAHAPGGKPVKQMEVSVQVGSMKKTVRVHGPRKWQRTLGVTRMGETEPFTRMPLHYGYAFGGKRGYEKDEQTLAEACLHNPSGIGYAGSKTASQMHGAPAPSLEDPKKAVSKPDGSYIPCALSPLARHWSPRRELGGTYDEKWREGVFPLLPADFDEAYHQVAPVDQRLAYPSGGEEIMLKGVMSAFNVISFRLPQFPLHLHALRKDESSISALMYVDTLFFEAGCRSIYCSLAHKCADTKTSAEVSVGGRNRIGSREMAES
jgi:hypothetical protein